MLKSLFIHVTQITDLCFQFNLSFHILLPFTLFVLLSLITDEMKIEKNLKPCHPFDEKQELNYLEYHLKNLIFNKVDRIRSNCNWWIDFFRRWNLRFCLSLQKIDAFRSFFFWFRLICWKNGFFAQNFLDLFFFWSQLLALRRALGIVKRSAQSRKEYPIGFFVDCTWSLYRGLRRLLLDSCFLGISGTPRPRESTNCKFIKHIITHHTQFTLN